VAASLAILVGTALAIGALVAAPRIIAGLSTSHSSGQRATLGLGQTPSPSPTSTTGSYPTTFVGATQNSIALFNATTGGLIRVLTTAPPSGGDQYPSVTENGKTVYFVRSVGSCGDAGSSGGIWQVATDGGPESALVHSPAPVADLEPTVSADGRKLAWLRFSCRKLPMALYVLDLQSRAQQAISIPSDVEVDSLAWAPDDRHLLFMTAAPAPEVSILDTATAASISDGVRLQATTCGEQFPRFLTNGAFVALTCPTAGDTTGSAAVVFDATTGRELRTLQVGLPPMNAINSPFIVSLSLSPDGNSAIWAALPTPANRTSNIWRWSGGRAVQLPAFAEQVAW
jgi:Tol biopolymer transport system component